MTISNNTKQNLLIFTNQANDYILKVEKNELKAVKKGLWTRFLSSILGLKGYQLSTVLNYIKQNKEALDKWDKSTKFYEIMKGKLKHSKAKAPIDESLVIFINTLRIPLRDTQTLPHNVLTLIFNLAPNPNVAQACTGFYDTFYKNSVFSEIFKELNEAKDGLLAQLIVEAKKSLVFPYEDDQACQAYVKFIHAKLSTYAQEFGGISSIPTSEKSSLSTSEKPSIHSNYYQEVATWIENKRLVTFFEKFDSNFLNRSLMLAIKQKPLEEQALAIRQFLKTCPIKTLRLSSKELTYIVPEIGLLPNLKNLDLSHNQIKEIPKELGQLTHLENLTLNLNEIQEVPKELGRLTNLKELYLSSNQLKKIPEELGQLIHLETLFLDRNKIKEVPKKLGQLTNLKKLLLSYNLIKRIPKALGQLTNLKTLILDNNCLKKIPKAVCKMKKLEDLFLAHNLITEIPQELSQLTNLQQLALFKNQITKIPSELNQLANLQQFDLSYNRITEIPSGLNLFKKLTELYLSYNLITEIPSELNQLANLQRFNLSHNRITKIPSGLNLFKKLTELYLSYNLITEIPDPVYQLTNLKKLDLSHNHIKEIPGQVVNSPPSRLFISYNDQFD